MLVFQGVNHLDSVIIFVLPACPVSLSQTEARATSTHQTKPHWCSTTSKPPPAPNSAPRQTPPRSRSAPNPTCSKSRLRPSTSPSHDAPLSSTTAFRRWTTLPDRPGTCGASAGRSERALSASEARIRPVWGSEPAPNRSPGRQQITVPKRRY